MRINDLIQAAHANAIEKGWWETDRPFGEIIALMHSELSEALEHYRDGYSPDQMFYTGKTGSISAKPMHHIIKPDGIPAEFADVLIRIFDACGRYGIDLERAVSEKMDYNRSRPHKHGGKVI